VLEDKAPDAPYLKQSSGLALGLTDLRRTKGLRGIAKAGGEDESDLHSGC
jgi:hypothetical protein